MNVSDERVRYQHPKYHIGTLTIKTSDPKGEYPYEVYRDGENIANFEDGTRASNYVLFLRGERMRI